MLKEQNNLMNEKYEKDFLHEKIIGRYLKD
jgi:hypothetical protein